MPIILIYPDKIKYLSSFSPGKGIQSPY